MENEHLLLFVLLHIFSADFGSTTYDWDHMLASYSGDYSDEEAKAVGTLMYHAGENKTSEKMKETCVDFFILSTR